MKHFIFHCLLFLAWKSTAQTVTATVGSEGKIGNTTLDYTVGEAFVSTIQNGSIILTQGFHQPLYKVSVLQEAFLPGTVNVFPNPVTALLHVQFKDVKPENMVISLFDLGGKIILTAQASGNNWQTDLSNLPGASYLLQVSDPATQCTSTFKIIKSN